MSTELTYPVLVRYRGKNSEIKNLIVLFTAPTFALVLYNDSYSQSNIGEWSGGWTKATDRSVWKPLTGLDDFVSLL